MHPLSPKIQKRPSPPHPTLLKKYKNGLKKNTRRQTAAGTRGLARPQGTAGGVPEGLGVPKS